MWQTGSYDPVNKLTIWGTGNPVPQYDPQSRPGDNLFTECILALGYVRLAISERGGAGGWREH